MKIKYILLFMFLVFIVSTAFAREGGKSKEELNTHFRNKVEEMKTFYDNGDLDSIIDLYFKECCKEDKKTEKREFRKIKKEIRADIYRQVFLSYTELDKPDLADIYLKKFLVIRRGERTDDFWRSLRTAAKDKYYVAPRWLVGLKLGANFTFPHPVNRYQVLKPASETGTENYQKDYVFHLTHSRGLQAGIILEYALRKNLSVTVQPMIVSQGFQYKNSFKREGETADDTVTLNYTHRQKLNYIEMPVLLKYRFIKTKLKPYAQVGVYCGLLQSAVKSLKAVSEPDEDYKDEAILKIKELFTRFTIGLWIGGGIGYETGEIRLAVEVNYRHGLNNIVDKDRRYDNPELQFAYYDVFDDIMVRNVELSLKVMLPLSFKAFRRQ